MTGIASRSYLATPLHARTAELCATNAWTEACGFTVPALYTSAREEQDALISRVVLSDLSARQCWTIAGADAAHFLSAATIGDVAGLQPGQAMRTAWCDDGGFARGDGWLACAGKAGFELRTTVRDFAWFADAAAGFDVKLANVTGTRAGIGVQGPLARQLIAAAGLSGEPVGDGIELWTQADDAIIVWDRLWRAGAGLGIAAAGAGTLEALRIELGVAQAGIDWEPVQLARSSAGPCVPADLGFAPDPVRRFNGASALERMKTARPQVLVQFSSDDILAPGSVTMRGASVGRLTSQAWSESRACTMALGWLDADAVKIGTKVTVPAPGGTARAEIARQLFEKPAGT